ncbi:MAG: flavin reductase [Acidimicrobiia bacterium]|nr:flavin reductase [Acidimicrobiia bacterium]
MTGEIHDEHPFAAPVADRDPVRRFRGRLGSPITIITAGDADGRTGLTVSSLMVAEGEPSRVFTLIGPTTDLFQAMEETGRFVVHICEDGHGPLADVFAGLRPSPGGLFIDSDVTQTEYGPVLDDLPNRMYCSYLSGEEETYSVLVEGIIEEVELTELPDPLVYFRGKYRSLAD